MAPNDGRRGALCVTVDDRFRGTLLGAVIGDALGAPLEGCPGPVPHWRVARLHQVETTLRHTDDSAMTFALAESLLVCGDLDQDHLAATFAAHYQRQPGRGYGVGTADLLRRVGAGEDWRRVAPGQFGGQGSLGNGAAMRVAPVALHATGDVEQVVELARRSALVTHAHPEGVDGAAVQAAAVAGALSSVPARPLDREEFLALVRRAAATYAFARQLDLVGEVAGRSAADVAARIGNNITAKEAVPAAICAFVCHPDSFADCVRFAISLGGDTDTIGSMAGAIVGARLGASAIPPGWADRAEGAVEAISLADQFRLRLAHRQPAHDQARSG